MIDPLTLTIGFFLICALILIIAVGIRFFKAMLNVKAINPNNSQQTEEKDDSSEGDALMTLPEDDILLPTEPDDD